MRESPNSIPPPATAPLLKRGDGRYEELVVELEPAALPNGGGRDVDLTLASSPKCGVRFGVFPDATEGNRH
jgi:hypothetical protein